MSGVRYVQDLRDVGEPLEDFAAWVIAVVGCAIGTVAWGWPVGAIVGCVVPTFAYQLGAVHGESEYSREKACKSRWAKFERGLGLLANALLNTGVPACTVFFGALMVLGVLSMLGVDVGWSLRLWLSSP